MKGFNLIPNTNIKFWPPRRVTHTPAPKELTLNFMMGSHHPYNPCAGGNAFFGRNKIHRIYTHIFCVHCDESKCRQHLIFVLQRSRNCIRSHLSIPIYVVGPNFSDGSPFTTILKTRRQTSFVVFIIFIILY